MGNRNLNSGIIGALILIYQPLFLSGQAYLNTDSLLNVINTTRNIKTKIDAMNTYAFEFRRSDPDKGRQISEKAFQLSRQLNYSKGFGDYFNNRGTFIFPNDIDSSIYFYRKAISEYKKSSGNEMRISRTYCNLANDFILVPEYDSTLFYARLSMLVLDQAKFKESQEVVYRKVWNFKAIADAHYYRSVWDSSLIYYLLAEEYAVKSKDKNAIENCLMNKANIYAELEEYDKAILVLQKAVKIQHEIQDRSGVVLALTNLARYYAYSMQADLAKAYVDSAIFAGNKFDIKRNVAANYLTLGYLEMNKNNYRKALEYYKTGWKYTTLYPNNFVECILLISIGEALNEIGKYHEAISFFKLASKNNDRRNIENAIEISLGLSIAYEHLNVFPLAYENFKVYHDLKDSVINIEKTKLIYNLNLKYETTKKEEEIKLLAKESELQIAIAEKEEFQKKVAYGTSSFLLVLSGLGFYIYGKRRKTKNEQELLRQRLRISRDLHDDVGATISSISIYSAAIKQKLSENDIAETNRMLDRISEEAGEVVTGISDMVWAISPRSDTVEKLFERLHTFASGILSAKDIFIQFRCNEDAKSLHLNMEARKNIYLLCKEALNNAAKYSDARIVKMDVSVIRDELTIRISDDGKGFDVSVRINAGNGLENMKQRAANIKASFTLNSEPTDGTEIIVTYTLPKNGEF